MTHLVVINIAVLLFIIMAAFVTMHKLPFTLWSPFYAIVIFYLIMAFMGYLYFNFSSHWFNSFYDIGTTRVELLYGFLAFLVAVASMFIGALIYVNLSYYNKELHKLTIKYKEIKLRYVLPMKKYENNLLYYIILSVPLVLIIFGRGFSDILIRDHYLGIQYRYMLVSGMMLSLPSIFILGLSQSLSDKKSWKYACIILFIFYELIFVSLSSRRGLVIFVFYILGIGMGERRPRKLITLWIIWIILLPFMTQIPLNLRGMPQQGLLMLPQNIVKIGSPEILIANFMKTVPNFIQNVTFGVPLTGYVKNEFPIPLDYFFISINPLPSFITFFGIQPWYEINQDLRVHSYIPYNTLGELLNHGWLFLCLYFVVIGYIAARIDVLARIVIINQYSKLQSWGYLISAGMLILFALMSTQYNLRSSTRFVYYALVTVILWDLYLKNKKRRKTNSQY